MARLIDWTGERAVPWAPDVAMLYEHYHRYLWGARLVEGRRVLDLGCGEGYGTRILASAASEAVGVDIDPRTVEHASANHAGPGVTFEQASALDLSLFQARHFDVVVAFEMIEHVDDHERVMSEIERVLTADGLLVISTPDKDRYSEASGQVNEFHVHELTLAEFRSLLSARFEHIAVWGQRTITGSRLHSVEGTGQSSASASPAAEFLVAASAGGLEPVEEPEPLFCVAVASNRPLPPIASSSTLADHGLELVRQTAAAYSASVAERDRLLAEANEELYRTSRALDEKREEVLAVAARLSSVEQELLAEGDRLAALEHELADAHRFVRRVEESVVWQAKAALYGLIGENTRFARALGRLLRLLGRPLVSRRKP